MRRVFNVADSTASQMHTLVQKAPTERIEAVQTAWVHALRSDCGRQRDALLCRLAETTQELADQYPKDPKVLLWKGVALTGYAKSLGGICSLQFQALAKTALERAIALTPHDGAAYLYLGLLYDQAPPAPYGFGDEKTARELLEQGLTLTLNNTGQARSA